MARARDDSPPQETRSQPHSLDAERAVLGTFFLNPDAVSDVHAVLSPEDFYDPRHQALFEIIVGLLEEDTPVDLTVVLNEVERRNLLERLGGPAYISGLQQYVVAPGNVLHHARIVHEKSLLRSLIRVSAEISKQAWDEEMDAHDLVVESERRVFEILKGREAKQFATFEEVVQEVWEDVARRSEHRQEVTGLPTHYRRLDQLTGGLQRSDLLILAARPSMGKTSLALNLAYQAAHRTRWGEDGHERPGVAVFSLEMSRAQVVQRMVCTAARIPMDRVRKNMLTRQQVEAFKETAEELRDVDIFINDTPGIDPVELRLQAQHLKIRHPNLALIVIDYLQLMSVKRSRTESRQQEVSEISRSLKGIARDLDVPVLALSQLSRGIENRRGADREPRLSDLRESGAIEQDADVVMFIHRRVDGQPDTAVGESSVFPVDLVIAKQRNGPLGRVEMLFRSEFTEFVELATESA